MEENNEKTIDLCGDPDGVKRAKELLTFVPEESKDFFLFLLGMTIVM